MIRRVRGSSSYRVRNWVERDRDLEAVDLSKGVMLELEATRIRPVVIARVHEVALKGRNRRHFMRVLTGNIACALRDVPYQSVKIRTGRILVALEDLAHWPEVRARIERVFGIQNFSLTLESDTRISSIRTATGLLLDAQGPPKEPFAFG